jgi:hypothetical protein
MTTQICDKTKVFETKNHYIQLLIFGLKDIQPLERTFMVKVNKNHNWASFLK